MNTRDLEAATVNYDVCRVKTCRGYTQNMKRIQFFLTLVILMGVELRVAKRWPSADVRRQGLDEQGRKTNHWCREGREGRDASDDEDSEVFV